MSAWNIVDAMARHAGLQPRDVCGGRRFRKFTNVRRDIAAHLDQAGYSCEEIGRAMGMHHTSVLYLLRRTWVSTHRKLDETTDSRKALMELQLGP